MIIDSIQNGIVIDHITAGKAMELYNILGLDKLDCTVAIIEERHQRQAGTEGHHQDRPARWTLTGTCIGYVDPTITVNIIQDGKLVEKRELEAAGADPGRAEVQEPPLHHLRGAGAASGIPS